jgi:transposase-like protein
MDKKEKISKEAIVAEYLTGILSYRGLESKYGIPSRTICDWVLDFQGRKLDWEYKTRRMEKKEDKPQKQEQSKDVKILQEALRRSQLKNELLEEMLKLSENYTGVDLRKKFGAKR